MDPMNEYAILLANAHHFSELKEYTLFGDRHVLESTYTEIWEKVNKIRDYF